MIEHGANGFRRMALVILLACPLSSLAGFRTAIAQCNITVGGIGYEESCDTRGFCYHGQCIIFKCSGHGHCGPNGGQGCSYDGCAGLTCYNGCG